MNLASVDLNLLVALEALLEEASVTRAATRIGLSQPAASNALARLRALLGDPLLVRTPDGMRPTPRAEQLREPLGAALRLIRSRILAGEAFDPKTSRAHFRIACSDYEQLVVVPPLMARLATEAPGITLEFVARRDRDAAESLRAEGAELAIGLRETDRPGLVRAPLLEETFLCLLRRGHPLAGKRLTPKRLGELDHVLVSPFGGVRGSVDDALEAQGLRRTVRVALSQFAVAPWILLGTDCVLTLPARAARRFAEHLPLVVSPPPLAIPPFKLELFWHERTHADPAHRWLRALVTAAVS